MYRRIETGRTILIKFRWLNLNTAVYEIPKQKVKKKIIFDGIKIVTAFIIRKWIIRKIGAETHNSYC